jgi:hypothetical protein
MCRGRRAALNETAPTGVLLDTDARAVRIVPTLEDASGATPES